MARLPMMRQFVSLKAVPLLYTPPPYTAWGLEAVLPAIVQPMSVGRQEPEQLTPPPCDSVDSEFTIVFPLIVQSISVGLEALQTSPPPSCQR